MNIIRPTSTRDMAGTTQRSRLERFVFAKGQLVKEWAADHQEELMQDWEYARNGATPHKIEPL